MGTSIEVPSQTWQVGAFEDTFDTPPENSTGYRVSLDNRPNWPTGQCVRINVDVSFDEGATWQADSENTFSGQVTGKGGVSIPNATVTSGWPTIMVNGVPTLRPADAVRVTLTAFAVFEAALSAGWSA